MFFLEMDRSVAVLMSLTTLALGDVDAALSNDWNRACCVFAS